MRLSSRLWYPGMESERTPKFKCLNCEDGPTFDSLSQYTGHVGRCVRMNEPEPPERNAFNDYLDPEQVAYVKRANREGRKLRGVVGSRGTLTPRRTR